MDIYTEQIIDLAKHPLNRGALAAATKTHSGVNVTCGDHVRIYLKVKDGRVEKAQWEGDGCAIHVAASSMITEEATGKSIEELKSWGKGKMFDLLGVEPGPARVKCAILSWETLEKCIN